MSSSFWKLIVFVVYFAVLIGIAISRVRPMDDVADYMCWGGRKMGPFTSALSPDYGR